MKCQICNSEFSEGQVVHRTYNDYGNSCAVCGVSCMKAFDKERPQQDIAPAWSKCTYTELVFDEPVALVKKFTATDVGDESVVQLVVNLPSSIDLNKLNALKGRITNLSITAHRLVEMKKKKADESTDDNQTPDAS